MIAKRPSPGEMYNAVVRRDATYDGIFFVCVRSTGIFCRPSCPARKPQRRNTAFHSCVRDALLAGFRPCKRCRPLAVGGGAPDWLDALLARIEVAPAARLTDQDLRDAGVSPHRVRRYFTENFGMTFQAYHRMRRMGLALEQLRGGSDALAVGLDCGYESQSGFRDAFARAFGVPPGRGDSVECVRVTTIESPLGPLAAGATDEGVCLLEFADRRAFDHQTATLRKRLGASMVPGEHPHLEQLREELDAYFAGRRVAFDVPLVTPGTAFQQTVWNRLRAIPYGRTRSYEQIAAEIGRPGAQRAVGRANGDNRIAILLPCHRVVRADGGLSGYGGGVWRKRWLIDHERACSGGGGSGRVGQA